MKQMSAETQRALWLRSEGAHIVLLIEHGGEWVEIMREPAGAFISHIIEPRGIARIVNREPGIAAMDCPS